MGRILKLIDDNLMEGHEQMPKPSEESIIVNALKEIEERITAGKPNVAIFIEDLTGEGPSSPKAIEKTLEIAEKIKALLAAKGYKYEVDRDPLDFRDFYFDLEKTD